MVEQNSNTQVNTGSEPIVSSAKPTAPAQSIATNQAATKKKGNTKTILFIILGAIGATAICAAVYFLFLNPDTAIGNKVDVYDADNISDGSQSDEETIKDLDQRIADAGTNIEKIDATLSKVRYMFLDEEYDEALAILGTIDSSGLDDYDLYRLYNHFYAAYDGKGDTANANRYKALADEAYARDVANYQ